MRIRIDDETWDYDPAAITLKELMQLKVQAGLNSSDFLGGNFDDPRVLVATVWLARQRSGEKRLKFDDVDAKLQDIEWLPDDEDADEVESDPKSQSTSVSDVSDESLTGSNELNDSSESSDVTA